jgi:MFS transporter, PAT family, solute carrier family 33 (acetyl-CoA transportor), member 1
VDDKKKLLLNNFSSSSNLGGRWVKTFFLWLVDIITWKSCVYDEFKNSTIVLSENKCVDKAAKSECIASGGRCNIDIDGYYIEVALNVVYGLLWYSWGKRTLEYLQNLNTSDWHVLSSHSIEENPEESPLECINEKRIPEAC